MTPGERFCPKASVFCKEGRAVALLDKVVHGGSPSEPVLTKGDKVRRFAFRLSCTAVLALLAACAPDRPPPPIDVVTAPEYQIGPGDSLYVFVWRNPELSLIVP